MLTDAVDNDIFEHLRMGTMALLPTRDILENLYELYEHNFDENLPAHKRKFFLTVGVSNKIILARSLLKGSPIWGVYLQNFATRLTAAGSASYPRIYLSASL